MNRIGFDNDKYLSVQSAHIRERIAQFGDKLYLEFGGKLFDDYHASLVLPGFAPDSKLQMLLQLADQAEMIISINAADIERNKIRHDLGITYDQDVIRLIDVYKKKGLYVSSVVITRYAGQPSADLFQKKLEAIGIHVYHHYSIEGYPNNIDRIVSDEGYGKNDYIKTTRPLVIVTSRFIRYLPRCLRGFMDIARISHQPIWVLTWQETVSSMTRSARKHPVRRSSADTISL